MDTGDEHKDRPMINEPSLYASQTSSQTFPNVTSMEASWKSKAAYSDHGSDCKETLFRYVEFRKLHAQPALVFSTCPASHDSVPCFSQVLGHLVAASDEGSPPGRPPLKLGSTSHEMTALQVVDHPQIRPRSLMQPRATVPSVPSRKAP